VERALTAAGFPAKKNDEINVDKFTFHVSTSHFMFLKRCTSLNKPFPFNNSQDFFKFYMELVQRKEVEEVYNSAKTGKGPNMSIDDFVTFVNSQRDPRLNEILYPYCTREKAEELIARNEPHKNNVKV